MKDKIILFVIGLLVGAVISTGAFYVYTTTSNSCSNNQNTKVISGQPPEMPSGGQEKNGRPPEKPNGENGQSSEKPSDNTQNNNTQENN